ncbi:hypothetical protein NYR76_06535 [Actinobacillus equuli subsp. equuli]|uniref:hypothetical protein n=1 Tax=Actinobacillus equuli TaxID=718 RepID=UPI0018CCA093|nr:hypothetical protein [Actinobacillus equuli]WGE43622.1 hypothetical protein NYR65_06800 [Actinobacillus equuli subsp. equuli]WGE64544.1 hypothetical protein NYR76_06535 [Actinobacillus equuli subsp. equuli]
MKNRLFYLHKKNKKQSFQIKKLIAPYQKQANANDYPNQLHSLISPFAFRLLSLSP